MSTGDASTTRRAKKSGTTCMGRDQLVALLSKYEARVRIILTRELAGPRDALVSVKDVLQEVWIAAFLQASRANWNAEIDVERWLVTVARRKAHHTLRSCRALKRGGNSEALAGRLDPGDTSLDGIPSPQRTPSGEAAAAEASLAIQEALTRLPRRERRVVSLRYLEGLGLPEIAQATNMSEAAVKGLLLRGVRRLRGELGWAGRFFSDADCDDDDVPECAARDPPEADRPSTPSDSQWAPRPATITTATAGTRD